MELNDYPSVAWETKAKSTPLKDMRALRRFLGEGLLVMGVMEVEETFDSAKERKYWVRVFMKAELDRRGPRTPEGLESFQRESHSNETGSSDTNPSNVRSEG